MDALKIKRLVLGIVQTNCYIISNEDLKEAIVIDPSDTAVKIEEYLRENDLTCKGILLTHGHFDHIIAADDLALHTKAKVYVYEDEAELLGDPYLNVSLQCNNKECRAKWDVLLKDQEVISIAGFTICVLHTPGHTKGGVCYYFTEQKILISGDTLFYESIGRTDFPTGNLSVLLESIRNRLMVLDDDVKVYTGHGMPTTIAHERKYNMYINEIYKSNNLANDE
jgi:hydroxyacylglutathione hydrolase